MRGFNLNFYPSSLGVLEPSDPKETLEIIRSNYLFDKRSSSLLLITIYNIVIGYSLVKKQCTFLERV